MAKSTIFLQPQLDNMPDEMEAELISIVTSGPDNPSFKPDLEDNQKRWLIVGICLQSIITPALRTYIEPHVLRLYNSLKQSRRINNQTHNTHMPGTSSHSFNYASINNNTAKHRTQYNYSITSHVDFSKLFLATNMTQYATFDTTIDLSALLGIMINMDVFSQILRTVAKEVRSNVRNVWAHCNFDEWDALQYQSAFQKMFQLIRHLNLSATVESELSAELTKWEGNGFQFLQGYALGQEVVKEFRQHMCLLIEYVLKKKSETDENFSKVHFHLLQIDAEFSVACKSIEDIKRDKTRQDQVINAINEEVSTISGKIIELKTSQQSVGNQLTTVSHEVKDIAKNQEALQTEQKTASLRVTSLEEKVQLSDEQLKSLQNDIKGFRNYMSHSRPGKLFFYPPDRTECFVSREQELMMIEYRFNQNDTLQYTQVICGLGGCGKTTLSVEFAWRCQEMYPGGVFWMSAESSESLEDSVALLAIDVNTTGKNSQETLRKTLKWLSSVSEKWLLVIDNADEETFSRQTKELLFGSWKRGSKGHIIITTRREQKEVENSMLIKKEDSLSLCTLNCEEGATFLRKRTCLEVSEDDDDDISAIVDELGGLPLALEQAAAHIKSLGCSFGEYIRRFQKKRLKLLKAMPTITQISQERLTVKTTWQLNIDYICEQSENEGIGTAAKTVMDITSFLFSDDIPISLINIGDPKIIDDDLVEALEDQDSDIGLKQIVEILTRFSLFQSFRSDALSVHRLVQEVIRDSMDMKRKSVVLKIATRMINFALNQNDTPYTILWNQDNIYIRRGALYMWNKIAMNANILKEHLLKVSRQIKSEHDLCFNTETINILQTTAIYHSLHQRQDRALADQEQMSLIIPSLDIDEDEYRKVTAVSIPLQLKDRERIQECLVSVIYDTEENGRKNKCTIPLDAETLRLKGNDAFKNGKYEDALQYYTESIKACPENNIDCKILANRSQLYIKTGQYQNALNDANQCIEIAPDNYNAYVSKAYAVAEMIDCDDLPPTWEGVGLASASVAAYINKSCLLKLKMKICYPVVNYVMVDHKDIGEEVLSGTYRPFTTFMLRKGRYDLKNIFLTPKSFQVIGVEDGVEINTGMTVRRPLKEELAVDVKIEAEIQIHFENIFFVSEGGQISVDKNCRATFYKCKLSNGEKGCDAFPKCKGGTGCLNPCKCKVAWQMKKHSLGSYVNGQVGHAGVCAKDGGRAYLLSCILDRCGGGGVLSSGDGSLIEINNCIVQNMRQMGIEARDGGAIKAENNTIIKNQTHGVAIGPRGLGYLARNTIQGNGQEGIWCGGIAESQIQENFACYMMNSKGGSKATIIDNVISQNGLSGLSFDGGCYYIKGNRIFENWLWGMMVKSRSSCYILNNDIFESKSGGIRVGANYSASVLLDGNTIRDHTGPALYALYAPVDLPIPEIKLADEMKFQVGDDETLQYSRAVMKTNTNVLRNNNKGVQHPKDLVDFIQKCCYCHELSSKLKQCSKCKKASYCSKDCQKKHWKRHKHICQLLQESYMIEIRMADTKPFLNANSGKVEFRQFDHKLRGIREGPPPDKTTSKKFIVKIQSGKEYSYYDPETEMMLYDRSVTLDIFFSNPVLYHLANECGILAGKKFTTKKIFCWASFKDKGNILCIHTDNLPPFQTW